MRYGNFKFGDGTTYGQSPLDTQLWALLIDWNSDGIFEYFNEAVNTTHLKVTRGRKYLLNSDGTGFEPVDIGQLIVDLDNFDGRYHPYNSKSPLYPYIRPGVNVSLLTRLPVSRETYAVFTGQIENITPMSRNYEKVQLSALDGMRLLNDQEVTLTLQNNIYLDDAIDLVLTQSQWPWAKNLEPASDAIPKFWAPNDVKTGTLLHNLASNFLGLFFIGADGSAKFYARTHELSASKFQIEQADISDDILTRSPWEAIRNNVSVVGNPLTVQATTVVWSLNDAPQIGNGETIEVWGDFSMNGKDIPINSYVYPALNTDYGLNSQPDGSGTQLACTVNYTVYANKIRYAITNTSGTSGYVNLLQLRGAPLSSNSVTVSRSDSGSIALFGPKILKLNSEFLQDSSLAQNMADAILALLKDPQMFPTIKVISRPEIQYTLDLFDNIDLILEKLGIADNYRVGYIEHEWTSENGQSSNTIFGLELVMDNALSTVWKFPAQIGIDSIFSF